VGSQQFTLKGRPAISANFDPLNQFDKLLDSLNETGLELWAYTKYPVETFVAKLSWAYVKLPLYVSGLWMTAFGVFASGQATISQEQPVRKANEHVENCADSSEATQEAESVELVSATGSSIEPGYVYKKFTIKWPK
jgi:hypothetical protein